MAARPSVRLLTCVRKFCSSHAMRRAKIELEDIDARTDMRQWVRPGNFQKAVLIIGKAFKKPSEIPPTISPATMKKAMDIFRGRMMTLMVILSFVGAHFAIQSGRKMAEQGDSLSLRGTIQEEQWREEGRIAREAANQK